MRLIKFIPIFFAWTLLTFTTVFAVFWVSSSVFESVQPDVYNNVRDTVRVFRTKYFRPKHKYRFLEIHPEYLRVDASSILRVDTEEQVKKARKKLTSVVWKTGKFPVDLLPTRITTDIKDPVFSKLRLQDKSVKDSKPNLVGRIDEFQYKTSSGFLSKAYHLIPQHPNGSLVVYHEGNTGSFHRNMKVIEQFLREGFEVLAFSMWIIDHKPTINVKGAGHLKMIDHSFLKFLEEPLRIYIDPIVAGINILLNERRYERVIGVGFSGGGWVVTLYAALDTRITLSYPVAGSYPLYLRRFRNWSTWQETWPPLIAAANYLDLYVMATDGPGRRQMQILNQYDGCCYSGLDWQTYAEVVRKASTNTGGRGWDIFVDITHADHRFSKVAMKTIIDDIRDH